MPVSAITKDDFRPKSHAAAARVIRKKTALTSEQFEELSKENKARAVRIARVEKLRLIQQFRDYIHSGVKDGRAWRDILNEIEEAFKGEGIPAPSWSRIRIAYRQNTLHAYNVARERTLNEPEMTVIFPYRQYLTVGNGRAGVNNVRPRHAHLHGKVFAWNDAFWRHFTPPWEWGCRCFFVALTAGMVKRRTIWTYKSGRIVPAAGPRRKASKPIAMKPHPDFDFPRDSFDARQFDVKGLDRELQKVAKRLVG